MNSMAGVARAGETPSPFRFGQADQNDLWTHMFKKCVVRLGPRGTYTGRGASLAEIEARVVAGTFRPHVHGFLCASKNNGVARFIPVQNFETTAVYFGCVDVFDEDCAELAVSGTYGGWSLGGKRKEVEEAVVKRLFEEPTLQPQLNLFEPEPSHVPVKATTPGLDTAPDADGEAGVDDDSDDFVGVAVSTSVPSSPYNKASWFENWQEFWKVLAATTERESEGTTFVSFDVANFYDTIDLRILHSRLRDLPAYSDEVANVLLELLAQGNPQVDDGARSTTGIPQDVVGDSSRVLANFYLVPFDKAFKEAVDGVGGKFIRWADDVTFTCATEAQVTALLYFASQRLHEIGLNINAGKVRVRTRNEFNLAWGFDVMDKILQPELLEDGLTILRDRWEDPGYDRRDTALRSSLRILRGRTELSAWRQWIFQNAMALPGFAQRLDSGKLFSLVTISEDPVSAAQEISALIMGAPFSEPKCHLLRFLEKSRHNEEPEYRELYERVKQTMLDSGHPVQILAATFSPYEGERP